jgi:hypothetical protein
MIYAGFELVMNRRAAGSSAHIHTMSTMNGDGVQASMLDEKSRYAAVVMGCTT